MLRAETEAACRRHPYGTGKLLGWLVNDKKITPHIPVRDQSQRRDGSFSRVDFAYDAARDIYLSRRQDADNDRPHSL